RQPRPGHHQDQGGTHEHPRVVGRALGVSNCLLQPGDTISVRRGGLRQDGMRGEAQKQYREERFSWAFGDLHMSPLRTNVDRPMELREIENFCRTYQELL